MRASSARPPVLAAAPLRVSQRSSVGDRRRGRRRSLDWPGRARDWFGRAVNAISTAPPGQPASIAHGRFRDRRNTHSPQPASQRSKAERERTRATAQSAAATATTARVIEEATAPGASQPLAPATTAAAK